MVIVVSGMVLGLFWGLAIMNEMSIKLTTLIELLNK